VTGVLLVVAAVGAGVLLALAVGKVAAMAILHTIHLLLKVVGGPGPEPGA
jgi:hypothetical protein